VTDSGRVTTYLPVADEAAHAAAEACARAGVVVRSLDTLSAAQAAEQLYKTVWLTTDPPATSEHMRAIEHAGGYVVGAYADGRLIAASTAFAGFDTDLRPTLHSHVTGVLPDGQGRGIGRALKLHQRAWAVERGIAAITWTFDPLVRRNAWFNLNVLGAVGVEYLVDFYGPMHDGLNAGQATDRLFCRWDLAQVSAPALVAPGAVVPLPDDIEQLRRTDPEAAGTWRITVRDAVVRAMSDGLVARCVDTDGALVLAR
jgi:predicted GNAT superfamily acetyltransferase